MPSSAVQKCALRSEEHTSELQSHDNLVCRLLLEKKKNKTITCLTDFTRTTTATDTCDASAHTGARAGDLACPAQNVAVFAYVFFFFFFLMDRPPPDFPLFPPPPPFPT